MLKTFYFSILLLLFLTPIGVFAQNEALTPGALGIDLTDDTTMCVDSVIGKQVFQYYNFNGKNEKSSQRILAEWLRFFKKPTDFKESGFLTIRLILDCQGTPRLHRFYEMDLNYQRKTFSDDLKKQIWAFVQQLGGFKKGIEEYEGKKYTVNYYYYFIFKIENGEFKSIAP